MSFPQFIHRLLNVSVCGALLVPACLFSGCAYTKAFVKQTYYRAQVRSTPTPAIYKHILDRPTYFVFGKVSVHAGTHPLAVVTLASGTGPTSVVDVSHGVRSGSYYGLNLPPGEYRLVVVRDFDRDKFYRETEIVGERRLSVSSASGSDKVLAHVDISGTEPQLDSSPQPWSVPVREDFAQVESVVFPRGTIRTLNDLLFRKEMATLGLYEPGAFMETAPLMFYALEDDMSHKVPVVFVHGIEGSPRDFDQIVAQLDRRRYKPWFFYYPSGASLAQVSQLFYEIFLSGQTIPRSGPIVIVAHSMGGLIVRDALNRHGARETETQLGAFITIASPLGGHPKARFARRAPVVLPSWRDLDPSGSFIGQLHRNPLPPNTPYHLYYTFGHPQPSSESDGVVPLSSQLATRAEQEATAKAGFAAGHVEVLQRSDTVVCILGAIETVKSIFPEGHLRVLDEGGYDFTPGSEFSAIESYIIRSSGRYLDALVSGKLEPFNVELQAFVDACRGKTRSGHPAVTAWLKFHRRRQSPDPSMASAASSSFAHP